MKFSTNISLAILLSLSGCPGESPEAGAAPSAGTSGAAAMGGKQSDPVGGHASGGQGGKRATAPVTEPGDDAGAADASSPGAAASADTKGASTADGGHGGKAVSGGAGAASGGHSGSAGAVGTDAPSRAPVDSDEVVSVAFLLNSKGEPRPVVLFKGGYATYDESIVTQSPIDAAAHRAANPDSWTEWRRTSGKVDLKTSTGWQLLVTHEEAKPLPKGTPLSQLHESYVGSDLNANPVILIRWRYRFHEDGTFDYCKISEIAGTNPDIFSREIDDRAGHYVVDGFKLHLEDANGINDTYSFFYEGPVSQRMWIDGRYYVLEDGPEEVCSP
jgi:hypothetical protein